MKPNYSFQKRQKELEKKKKKAEKLAKKAAGHDQTGDPATDDASGTEVNEENTAETATPNTDGSLPVGGPAAT
jgi:hypothetical protein